MVVQTQQFCIFDRGGVNIIEMNELTECPPPGVAQTQLINYHTKIQIEHGEVQQCLYSRWSVDEMYYRW